MHRREGSRLTFVTAAQAMNVLSKNTENVVFHHFIWSQLRHNSYRSKDNEKMINDVLQHSFFYLRDTQKIDD